MLRGLRTLGLRMDRHYRNAMHVARLMESDLRVKRVIYSGLENHPQARLARRQMRGAAGDERHASEHVSDEGGRAARRSRCAE